jgi:spermidine/putrescine transport system ATP-binding protein
MQFELKAMQRNLGITFIFVTHDQEEAMTMADRIAVMDQGKVLQVGTPEEIYETPATQFVADFIGETNFIRGNVLSSNGKFITIMLDETTTMKAVSDQPVADNQEVMIALRPEKINVFASKGTIQYDEGSSESTEDYKRALLRDPNINLMRAKVLQDVYIGTDTRYVLDIPGNQDVVARVQNFGLRSDTYFTSGQEINIFWNAENARVLTK